MTERPDPLAEPEGYGASRTGNANAAQHETTTRTCSVDIRTGLCGQPAVVVITYGDRQEHIADLGFCAAHYSQVPGRLPYCTTCQDSGLGVDARMREMKRELLTGSDPEADRAQDALESYFG